MKSALAFGLSLFLITPVEAEILDIEYSRFYSHVKKLNDEDVSALQFAFGFVRVGEGRLCEIQEAQIITDKQSMPLEVTAENRFTVPSDNILKMAEALVRINLVEAGNLCDMSVQLETKPEFLKTEYSAQDLDFLYQQYQAFFNEMGSFLSFMMPSVKGLMMHFSDPELDAQLPDAPAINNGMLMLGEDWLEKQKTLRLPAKPLRITAIASKD